MKKSQWLAESAALIEQHFLLESPLLDAVPFGESQEQELLEQLTLHIRSLLDQDMPRLLQALYRIDVAESKVNAILSLAKPELIAPSLAQLIIDREYQKVETRKRYSSH